MRYMHDCTDCTFLGEYQEFDLYFCPQGGRPTVIARFGPAGSYYSGLAAADTIDSLREAKERAEAAGLIPKPLFTITGLTNPPAF